MIDERTMYKLQKLANKLTIPYGRRQAYIRRVNKEFDHKLRRIPKSTWDKEEFKSLINYCDQVRFLSYGGERAAKELQSIKEQYAGLVPDEFFEFKKICLLIDIIKEYEPRSLEDAIDMYNDHWFEFIYDPF